VAIDKDGYFYRFDRYRTGLSEGWLQVDCGADFEVALKLDGTLWGMGYNGSGQIGGPPRDKYVFTQIETADDWVQVACGWNFTVALKADGTLWGIGSNDNHQMGIARGCSFARIDDTSDWVQVACGYSYTIALKKDGTLWGLGRDLLQKIMVTGWLSRTTPIQIENDNDWVRVSSHHNRTAAIKRDGTVWELCCSGSFKHKNTQQILTRIGDKAGWTRAVLTDRGGALLLNTEGKVYILGDEGMRYP
jgi:alpha-tubulin suppressor-like RCC1 family protein